MVDKCAICAKVFSGTSKRQTCDKCTKKVHSMCGKLHSVRLEDDTIKKVCAVCVAEANPQSALSRSNSVTSNASPNELKTFRKLRANSASGSSHDLSSISDLKNVRPSTSQQSTTPAVVTISGEAWDVIKSKLDKLDKLDRIDDLVTSMENIGRRFESAEGRLDAVEGRLDEAESETAALRTDYDAFVETTSQKITEIKKAQELFQENLDSLTQNTGKSAGSGADPGDKERLVALEATNASLASKVQCLQFKQSLLAHSADLVIGGLRINKQTDLNSAAFAVIKTLKPDFLTEDIKKVTVLPSRRNRRRSSGPKDNNADSLAAIPPTGDVGGSGMAAVEIADLKTCSLIVTVSSSDLAKEIINAKIVWKKLSSAQISADLMASAQLPMPTSPATINVNAFLPSGLYKLRRLVLTKAKDKKNNFVTYMLDGCIYVRVKGEKLSTPIYAVADLDNFLEKLSAISPGT